MKALSLTLLLVFGFRSLAFASDYDRYESILARYWAVPNSSPSECQVNSPQYWKDKAENIISVGPITQELNLNSDEVMVLRNLLISQAYNRLFTYSLKIQNTETPVVKFFWIAAGSQASVTVGHALQVGLADKYPLGSRQRKVFRRLESIHPDVPAMSALLLRTIDKVKRKTAENNWRVYSDIFWQHLAYMTCGLNESIRLNQILVDENRSKGDAREVDHYERFISLWQAMEQGQYLEANIQLIYLEQHNILQRYMYDARDAKLANVMLLFNRMASAELADSRGGKIQTFSEYSRAHDLYPNLSYFPTRFKWMKYVVGEQAGYLQSLGTIPKMEAVLEKSLHESHQVVSDYLSLF
jgi:hypothetical protein